MPEVRRTFPEQQELHALLGLRVVAAVLQVVVGEHLHRLLQRLDVVTRARVTQILPDTLLQTTISVRVQQWRFGNTMF